MKVRIYRKRPSVKYIYILTSEDSIYATLHGDDYPYRSLRLPKEVVTAISKCSLLEQGRIAKILYKGSKKNG